MKPSPLSAPDAAEAKIGSAPSPLQELLQRASAPAVRPANAVVLGELASVEPGLPPRVRWPQGPAEGSEAQSLVALTHADVGTQVALSLSEGLAQPLILGLVWNPGATAPLALEIHRDEEAAEHVELSAQQQLTLRCGQASITLTADGQVLLRGTYIGSHSTGTQRIKGAAVRIN